MATKDDDEKPERTLKDRLKRWFFWTVPPIVLIAIALAILYFGLNEERPTGEPGEDAEQLATRLELAVNKEAWDRTGAIQFTFSGHEHLWDRTRNVSRVKWDEIEVLLLLDRPGQGVALENGQLATGERAKELLDEAYAIFCNDTFWLNPLVKFRDDGVRLSAVEIEDGKKALLVEYTQGGVTPGDAYLWTIGDDDLPVRWNMWVSILPIGGISASWKGWIELDTGAKISTFHELGPLEIVVENPRAARSLLELVGPEDPFARLSASGLGPMVAAPPEDPPAPERTKNRRRRNR